MPMTLPAPWQCLAPDAACDDQSPFPTILHFGTPERERHAAADHLPLFSPLLHLAALEISGADAQTFLQGQCTQDVSTLTPGKAQFSAWCSPKGRMLANFILFPMAENVYRLILSADLADFALKRLSMFILRSRVRIVAEPVMFLGLSGTIPAIAEIAFPKAPLEVTQADGLCAIRLPHPDLRLILCLPPERLADLWPSLSAHALPVGQPVWHWLDIRAGLPWITEATREEFVPQMADFEKLGVSFRKGCYVGQEVVARAQHLGKVKRHLYRLKSATPLQPGEALFSPNCAEQPNQTAGKVVTAAPDPTGGHAALAVLLEQGAASLRQGGIEGTPIEAEPVTPPET